ncbi:MAG: RimK family protein [Desulfomonilia bacterium]
MKTLIVVNNPSDWQFSIPGVEIVAAWRYLDDPAYGEIKGVRLFNLCRSYQYQSYGYYVSLLAAARGHKPIPTVMTIQDMKSRAVIRLISQELDSLIQKSLTPLSSTRFELSVYFGRNLAKRYERLSAALFQLFETPFLRAFFYQVNGSWQLTHIEPISANAVPEGHREFVVEAAKDFFSGHRVWARRRKEYRYDLAILTNDQEPTPPSDSGAISRFVKAANALGLSAEIISKDDFSRLVEFDGLFIRETTNVNHHTYRFARKAETEGLVVIDDCQSILRCTNKVYLSELLRTHSIPMPKTLNIHRQNAKVLQNTLNYPIILKQPDSSFSQGVLKVESDTECREALERLFEKSAILIAQEFVPTDFDWRVGILDRKPLFVCRYYMAPHHWQIVKRDERSGRDIEGSYETLAIEKAPDAVIRLALRAANLIGSGLYGVDIKQAGRRLMVIEINDNPSIESDVEDAVLGEELYLEVMRVFLSRIEQKKNPPRR